MFNWSFALIAKNEEKTLPRFFQSIKYFMDNGGEVVILDTGSTDNTVKVARDAGCKVVEAGDKFMINIDQEYADKINKHFNCDDKPLLSAGDRVFNFGAARNEAASLTRNDMVSMPDCDEIWTKLDYDKVREAIDGGAEQLEYNFVFSHDQYGNELVKFMHCKFFNKVKQHWTGIVHEIIQGEARRQYFGEDVMKLEHYQNHETNRGGYLKGLAIDCYENPKNDRNSHYFARELLWSGRIEAAIKEFERHLTISWWKAERGQSMIFLGECQEKLGNGPQALDWYWKAYCEESGRREPLIAICDYFFKLQDWQKVVAIGEALLTIPQTNFYANFSDNYTHKPHHLLYVAYWWLGNKEKSTYHFDKAFNYQPQNPKYIHDKQYYHPEEYNYKDQGIDGYMSLIELNWLHEQAKHVDTILEIGSWKGRSTHALATGCKGKVTCIDTFRGSEDVHDLTNAQGKEENIYEQFMKNAGYLPNVEVIAMDSRDALKLLKDRKFDMVFIDAEHTYEAVKQDIANWADKATVVLCGHDYCDVWQGVKKAVNESVGPVNVCDSIWYTNAIPRIPKRIFSIWLGNTMPEKVASCIKTHEIEGYEHKLITLENCPKDISYLNQAIKYKNWVKAADYLRAYYLFNEGGIYLDADMDVLDGKNFNDLLNYSIFAGKEENGFIANSCIGAMKGHPVLEQYLKDVKKKFKGSDNKIFESGMELLDSIMRTHSDRNAIVLPSDYFFPYNHQTGQIKVTENTRVFHHFMKTWNKDAKDLLPLVSIIIPQLGREEGLKKCLTSIDKLYYPKHLIETIIVEGPDTVPVKVKTGYKKSLGDYIVYAANDTEFTPECLNIAVEEMKNLDLLSFNTGELYPDEGNICEHFIVRREFVDKFLDGEIFDTEFKHVGVDNLLWAKANKYGEAKRSEKAVMIHNHFTRGGKMDAIYEKAYENMDKDRELLQSKLNQLYGKA